MHTCDRAAGKIHSLPEAGIFEERKKKPAFQPAMNLVPTDFPSIRS